MTQLTGSSEFPTLLLGGPVRGFRAFASVGAFVLAAMLAAPALANPVADYVEHCADCHGENRLGSTGPALIPQTLKRMRGPKVANVITHGREATQMPAFAETLDEAAITELADWLKTPLDHVPAWDVAEIDASREFNPEYVAASEPIWSSDPMNITLAVETGDHHVSVLDGDTFDVLDRFPGRHLETAEAGPDPHRK